MGQDEKGQRLMSDRQEINESLKLEVLTPGSLVAQLSVPMVTLPGTEG